MAKIEIHAGDFYKVYGSVVFGKMILRNKQHPIMGESIPFNRLKLVQIATEESVKSLGGTLGWGAIGAVALGPAGLLAGLLLGGKSKEVTFLAELEDGRKFMATTDSKTFTEMQAAAFGK